VERLVFRELVKVDETLGILNGFVDVEVLRAWYRGFAIVALVVVDEGGFVVIHNLLHLVDFRSGKHVVLLVLAWTSVVTSSEADAVLKEGDMC